MQILCNIVTIDHVEVANNEFGDVFTLKSEGSEYCDFFTIYQIRAIAAYAEKRWNEAQS